MRNDLAWYPEMSTRDIDDALCFCVKQINHVLPSFTDKFQDAYSVEYFYPPVENKDWTNGFWTGEIWLAYEYTKDNPEKIQTETGEDAQKVEEKLLRAALTQVASFKQRIIDKVNVNHHDMGFLYSPSCVAAHKIIRSEEGRVAAIMAADQLITRYQEKGEFIQAWGRLGNPAQYRLIIDCLVNLPLLYWASEETGDDKYRVIAEKHIHTAVANVIRKDYSTYHTFFFNPETGEPDHGETHQGYRADSAWARGQAWGIYGLAMAYRYTHRESYIDLFKKVTEYFCDHLPEDLCPFWDLEFNDGDDQPRDSSSASIAACGILEMAKYLPEKDAHHYRSLASKLIKAIYNGYAVKDIEQSNGLVLGSTYANSSPYNTCPTIGVNECNIWGDYYYMEALTRMSKDWAQYW